MDRSGSHQRAVGAPSSPGGRTGTARGNRVPGAACLRASGVGGQAPRSRESGSPQPRPRPGRHENLPGLPYASLGDSERTNRLTREPAGLSSVPSSCPVCPGAYKGHCLTKEQLPRLESPLCSRHRANVFI